MVLFPAEGYQRKHISIPPHYNPNIKANLNLMPLPTPPPRGRLLFVKEVGTHIERCIHTRRLSPETMLYSWAPAGTNCFNANTRIQCTACFRLTGDEQNLHSAQPRATVASKKARNLKYLKINTPLSGNRH